MLLRSGFAGALAQAREGVAKDAGDLHLAEPHELADLALRHVPLEAQADDQAPLEKISAALSGQDGIAQVLPPVLNEAGDTATMIAYPTTTPQE